MRHIRPLLGTIAVASLLSGCGGSGSSSSESDASVSVTGTEYSFDAPATIEGGLTRIDYENVGAEPHEFALAKLADGKTAEDLQAAVKEGGSSGQPSWVTDDGGVSTLSPGAQLSVTRDLQPGEYAFICFIPNEKGVPHATLGMIRGFTVAGDSGAEPPATDGSIVATDKSFEISPLSAGAQTIELRNEAKADIGFNLFALEPGKTFDDLRAWFQNGLKGEAPAQLLGVTQFLKPAETQYLDLDLQAGTTYLMIDPDHGLQETFEVK